jgi:hypothetical protein
MFYINNLIIRKIYLLAVEMKKERFSLRTLFPRHNIYYHHKYNIYSIYMFKSLINLELFFVNPNFLTLHFCKGLHLQAGQA